LINKNFLLAIFNNLFFNIAVGYAFSGSIQLGSMVESPLEILGQKRKKHRNKNIELIPRPRQQWRRPPTVAQLKELILNAD
jgi:hypothetical protein